VTSTLGVLTYLNLDSIYPEDMGCTLKCPCLSVGTVSHQRKLQGFKLWLLCNACDMQLAKCSNSRYGQNHYLGQSVAHACLIKIIAVSVTGDVFCIVGQFKYPLHPHFCLGVAAMVRQH